MDQKDQQQVQIKMSDDMAKGQYANMMIVNHAKAEFTLDFISFLPPIAQVISRVITSPVHLKQVVKALTENLERYESAFGKIEPGEEKSQEFGFKVSDKS